MDLKQINQISVRFVWSLQLLLLEKIEIGYETWNLIPHLLYDNKKAAKKKKQKKKNQQARIQSSWINIYLRVSFVIPDKRKLFLEWLPSFSSSRSLPRIMLSDNGF